MKYYQNNKKSGKSNSRGFYIALGVCLVAIGVAAWTTYDSVVNIDANDSSSASSQAAPAEKNVSGVTVSSSAPESSKPESQPPVSSSASSKTESSKTTSSSAKKANAGVKNYVFPAGKTVSQKYSGDTLVYSKTMKDWRAHTGTDFAAAQGSDVKAMAAGTVKNVYEDDLYGMTVVIAHGDYEVSYCGLDKTAVKKDDKVTSGQIIGALGTVPCESTEEYHLHLMVKKSDRFADPMSILK